MPYTLNELATDIRMTLETSTGTAALEAARTYLLRALSNPAFIEAHLKDRAPGTPPREVLYEDPKLGFCICGHVYDGPAATGPHDHGASWAIYGQATGTTEMTDWRITTSGGEGEPSLVAPVRTYLLKPGEAHVYDVGDVHSPKREGATKLIRIEGQNLDRIKRSNIKAA